MTEVTGHFSERTFIISIIFLENVLCTQPQTIRLHYIQMFRVPASFEYFLSPQANLVGVSGKSVNKALCRPVIFLEYKQ